VLTWLEPVGGVLLGALAVAAAVALLFWLWRRRQ
jgi:hypothetical protein